MSKYVARFGLDSANGRECDVAMGVEFAPSGAFAYGNGMCMVVTFKGREADVYDIRYDKAYSKLNEIEYVLAFIKSTYTGKNGSWKAVDIEIERSED